MTPPPTATRKRLLSRLARGILLDGPGARQAISRAVPEGQTVAVKVLADGRERWARYKSIGVCDQVPKDDGVGLIFDGFADEERPA